MTLVTPASARPLLAADLLRNAIPAIAETSMAYARLRYAPNWPPPPPPAVDLVLVIDTSAPIGLVSDAVRAALGVLRPSDSVALVAYDDAGGRVLWPTAARGQDPRLADAFADWPTDDVTAGSTALDQGLAAALAELDRQHRPGRSAQMVVLAHGRPTDESACAGLALRAAEQRIGLTILALDEGLDPGTLGGMVHASAGRWELTEMSGGPEMALRNLLVRLTAADPTGVELRVWPGDGVQPQTVWQILPEVRRLPLVGNPKTGQVAIVGRLPAERPAEFLLALEVPSLMLGQSLPLKFDLNWVTAAGEASGVGPAETALASTAAPGRDDPSVALLTDVAQFHELNQLLQRALRGHDRAEAGRVAAQMSRTAYRMSPAGHDHRETATRVLHELDDGVVSRGTAVAVALVAGRPA
jgi:hypothetical protein